MNSRGSFPAKIVDDGGRSTNQIPNSGKRNRTCLGAGGLERGNDRFSKSDNMISQDPVQMGSYYSLPSPYHCPPHFQPHPTPIWFDPSPYHCPPQPEPHPTPTWFDPSPYHPLPVQPQPNPTPTWFDPSPYHPLPVQPQPYPTPTWFDPIPYHPLPVQPQLHPTPTWFDPHIPSAAPIPVYFSPPLPPSSPVPVYFSPPLPPSSPAPAPPDIRAHDSEYWGEKARQWVASQDSLDKSSDVSATSPDDSDYHALLDRDDLVFPLQVPIRPWMKMELVRRSNIASRATTEKKVKVTDVSVEVLSKILAFIGRFNTDRSPHKYEVSPSKPGPDTPPLPPTPADASGLSRSGHKRHRFSVGSAERSKRPKLGEG